MCPLKVISSSNSPSPNQVAGTIGDRSNIQFLPSIIAKAVYIDLTPKASPTPARGGNMP